MPLKLERAAEPISSVPVSDTNPAALVALLCLGPGLLRRLRDPLCCPSPLPAAVSLFAEPHQSKISHCLLSKAFKHPALQKTLHLAGGRVLLGLERVSIN